MKNKSKKVKIIIVILVTAVIAVEIGIIFFGLRSNSTTRKIQEQIALGRKYLVELDYENAIATYEKVIKIDPKCVEAYLGLAEVYVEMENYDSALEILVKGYKTTQDASLQDEIDDIKEMIEEVDSSDVKSQEAEITVEDKTEVNTEVRTDNSEEVVIDENSNEAIYDLTFKTAMYDFDIMGTTFSELTFDTAKNYALTQAKLNEEGYYILDGTVWNFDEISNDIKESSRVCITDGRVNLVVNRFSTQKNIYKADGGLNYLGLEEYTIINDYILDKTMEEFFNSISNGLYDVVKSSSETGKIVRLNNGYIHVDIDETFFSCDIQYSENNKEIALWLCSSSDDEVITDFSLNS